MPLPCLPLSSLHSDWGHSPPPLSPAASCMQLSLSRNDPRTKFNKQYFNDCQAPTQYQSRYPNVHSKSIELNSKLQKLFGLSLYCATGFSIWGCMGNKSWKTGWAWHYSKTELFVKPESEVPKSRQKGLGLTLTNHTCCSTSLLISIWRSSCTYYHNTPHHIIHS